MTFDHNAPEEMRIGKPVTVPDGRHGVIRFVYPAEHGPNLIVRVEDNSILVVPASKCRVTYVAKDDSGGVI